MDTFDREGTRPSVAAIVPAYNEEQTVGSVLSVLCRTELIDLIYVVDDGSSDRTSLVVRRFPVYLLRLSDNAGKGGALKRGVEASDAEVLLFCDADLIGLEEHHVEALITPIIAGRADMSVGVFDAGRLSTDLAQRVAPFLSGQRALRRDVLDGFHALADSRYGVEVALTRHAERCDRRVEHVLLPDVSHVMKEEKLGMWHGLGSRFKMYWEIIRSWNVS